MSAFSSRPLEIYLHARRLELAEAIGAIDPEEFLAADPGTLSRQQAEPFEDELLVLASADKRLVRTDQTETRFGVHVEPADRVTDVFAYDLQIPFTGSNNLVECTPSGDIPSPPRSVVCVERGEKWISLRFALEPSQIENLDHEVASRLAWAGEMVSRVNREAGPQLEKLEALAAERVLARRRNLEARVSREADLEAALSVPVFSSGSSSKLAAGPPGAPATMPDRGALMAVGAPSEAGALAGLLREPIAEDAGRQADVTFSLRAIGGEFELVWQSRSMTLKYLKGLEYYEYVLDRPLKLVPWSEFIKREAASEAEPEWGSADCEMRVTDFIDAPLELTDERAIRQCRAAEIKLIEKLARAGSPSDKAKIDTELRFVRKELRSARTKTGDLKTRGGTEEKVARGVRKNLRLARERIAAKCPGFAAFLEHHVRLRLGPGIMFIPDYQPPMPGACDLGSTRSGSAE